MNQSDDIKIKLVDETKLRRTDVLVIFSSAAYTALVAVTLGVTLKGGCLMRRFFFIIKSTSDGES